MFLHPTYNLIKRLWFNGNRQLQNPNRRYTEESLISAKTITRHPSNMKSAIRAEQGGQKLCGMLHRNNARFRGWKLGTELTHSIHQPPHLPVTVGTHCTATLQEQHPYQIFLQLLISNTRLSRTTEKWAECVSDSKFFSHSQEKHICSQPTQATKFTNEFGTVCINLNIFCLRVTNTQTALFFYALISSYLCNLVQDHIPMILQLDSHLVCHLHHTQSYATAHLYVKTFRKPLNGLKEGLTIYSPLFAKR